MVKVAFALALDNDAYPVPPCTASSAQPPSLTSWNLSVEILLIILVLAQMLKFLSKYLLGFPNQNESLKHFVICVYSQPFEHLFYV